MFHSDVNQFSHRRVKVGIEKAQNTFSIKTVSSKFCLQEKTEFRKPSCHKINGSVLLLYFNV